MRTQKDPKAAKEEATKEAKGTAKTRERTKVADQNQRRVEPHGLEATPNTTSTAGDTNAVSRIYEVIGSKQDL